MYTNNLQHKICLKNSPVLEGLFINYQKYWTTVDGSEIPFPTTWDVEKTL